MWYNPRKQAEGNRDTQGRADGRTGEIEKGTQEQGLEIRQRSGYIFFRNFNGSPKVPLQRHARAGP
jgi:hypothetical protein